MIVYELTNLEKIYHGRKILDISAITIQANEIYALLGPNGAGKSTLLNILGFLEAPSSGHLKYFSRPVRFNKAELFALRRDVVMVAQHPILFTTTVFKNLEFGLKIRKISKDKRKKLIEDALDLVGMRDFICARAHRLSGGETQRVALARALVLSPKVFLCDEPTSSVDMENQGIILNILKQIKENSPTTIIFTTHDRTQAASIADQTLLLDHGRLIPGGYENIFPASISGAGEKEVRCNLYPGVCLSLPPAGIDPSRSRIRIFLDPCRIKLYTPSGEPPPGNVFAGKVCQLVQENSGVRVLLDSGIRLTLIITEENYRQRHIMLGDIVQYHIPPEAIQILEPQQAG